MSKENTEVTELEILTPEQIKALPETVKENVVYLTENATAGQLSKINPIVNKLLDIKSEANKLVFVSIDDKESIDAYKSVKSSIGSFNSLLKKSAGPLKKDLKKPYDAVLAIEKTFKTISDETKESITEKFSDYEAEVLRKKEEAQAKKDAALNAKVAEAEAAAEEANLKNKKSTIYNTIKYEKIGAEINDKTTELINTANEENLNLHLKNLKAWNFGNIIFGLEFDILDNDVQTELRQYFATSIHNQTKALENKIEAVVTKRKLDAQEAIANSKNAVEQVQEVAAKIDEAIPPTDMPLPPTANQVEVYTEEFRSLNDKEFLNYILKESKKLKQLIVSRLKSHSSSEELFFLYNKLNEIQ